MSGSQTDAIDTSMGYISTKLSSSFPGSEWLPCVTLGSRLLTGPGYVVVQSLPAPVPPAPHSSMSDSSPSRSDDPLGSDLLLSVALRSKFEDDVFPCCKS